MDYNIYIHTVAAGGGGDDFPTTPFQLRDDGGEGGGSSGFQIPSGSSIARKVGGFLQNPDSAIAKVLQTPIGKIGIASVVIGTAINITDKVISLYNGYAAPASGNYSFSIQYNNFKQNLHNVFHPVSTEIQRQQNELRIKLQNAKNEQELQLYGGTILNAPYGRYL